MSRNCNVILICGHYKGIDERVIDELISTELAEEERVTEIFSTVVLVGVVDSSGVSMIGLFPPPPPQEIKKIKIKK